MLQKISYAHNTDRQNQSFKLIDRSFGCLMVMMKVFHFCWSELNMKYKNVKCKAMGDVESKLGSIGKTKEELSGVQVKHVAHHIEWNILAISKWQKHKHVLLLSFVLGDCDQTDNEYGDNDAHFTFERGQNSYLKSNRDILCIQEKLRKSQVDDKVKSRTEKESGSVIFAPLGILTHLRPMEIWTEHHKTPRPHLKPQIQSPTLYKSEKHL